MKIKCENFLCKGMRMLQHGKYYLRAKLCSLLLFLYKILQVGVGADPRRSLSKTCVGARDITKGIRHDFVLNEAVERLELIFCKLDQRSALGTRVYSRV
jgi:hypothetical protein